MFKVNSGKTQLFPQFSAQGECWACGGGQVAAGTALLECLSLGMLGSTLGESRQTELRADRQNSEQTDRTPAAPHPHRSQQEPIRLFSRS